MTDEKKIPGEGSLSYEEFCARLSSPAGTDLMYAQDAQGRVGLEVLWLKLSLLAEIIGLSRSIPVDLQHCHIKLLPTATHLPRFWNFGVEPPAAVADVPAPAMLSELGLCWFRTLVANPGQTGAEVDAVLKSLLAASGSDSNLLIDAAVHSPVLHATQLYTVKEPAYVSAIPADLWQRTLQIGLRLATRIPNFSYSSPGEDSLSAALSRVLMDIEALRLRVQTALFMEPPRMERDLGELLNELIRDPGWLHSLGAVSVTPLPTPVPMPVVEAALPEDEPNHNMESTIIIKRGAALPAGAASPSPPPPVRPTQAPPVVPAAEENLEATIIISKDKKR